MPDVIVIGAGAAGSSAAWACARAGLETLLLTDSLDTVFQAGLRGDRPVELDPQLDLLAALGESRTVMAARELHRGVRWLLEQQAGLHLLQASASSLLVEQGKVTGVTTWEGPSFSAAVVGLCVGSFLTARLEQGALLERAGKPGQMSDDDLADDLSGHGVVLRRVVYDYESPAGPGSVSSLVLDQQSVAESPWLRAPAGLAAAGYVLEPAAGFLDAVRSGQQLGRAIADRLGGSSGA